MSDMNKLAEALESYAPDGDGYNTEYARNLLEAAALLRAAAGADVQGLMEMVDGHGTDRYNEACATMRCEMLGTDSHRQYAKEKRAALESALRLALPVWRPIEEAPKDGTRVLLDVEWSDVPAIGSYSHGSWSADREHYEVSCGAFCYGGSVTTEKGFKPTHYMPLPPQPKTCTCEACMPQGNPFEGMRMILCAICGNKRCPHATDHRNPCTNSNEPGQAGSSYPPQPKGQI